MQSESIRAAIAAAVFLLAGGTSHAQNKCIDEKGRVTYQSDPCPGASARIRTPAEIGRGVPAAAPVPAPAPAPARPRAGSSAAVAPPGATYSGASPQALRAELNELDKCASDWDTYSTAMQLANRELKQARPRDAELIETRNRGRVQGWMARFLPLCGKYGFESPRDDAAMQRNSQAAQSLAQKIEAKRAQMDSAADREQTARASAGRARETAQQAERDRPQCERAARDIAEARAALPQMPPNLREKLQSDLAKADRQYAEACAR
jgi:hypothetical protein